MSPAARTVVVVGTAVALFAACEPVDAPVDPAWGRQPCAHCGMVLGEPRTSAELVTAQGARLYFDDVGCMLAYEHEMQDRPRHAWAHDASGPSWIDVERATFVGGESTPMDFGFVAHTGGTGYALGEVRARVIARLVEAGGEGDHGVP